MELGEKIVGNVVIVYPQGKLNINLAVPFEKKVNQIIQDHPDHHVLFNMKDVVYINSSSLRVVATVAQKLQKKNMKFRICEARDIVKRVFEITSVIHLSDIKETEEEALASF